MCTEANIEEYTEDIVLLENGIKTRNGCLINNQKAYSLRGMLRGNI